MAVIVNMLFVFVNLLFFCSSIASDLNNIPDSVLEQILASKINEFKSTISQLLEEKSLVKRQSGTRSERSTNEDDPGISYVGLHDCLNRLNYELDSQNELIRKIKDRVNKIWVTNQAQTIEAPVVINGKVTVQRHLTIRKIQITSAINTTKLSKDELESRINRNRAKVSKISSTIEHEVVRKDRTSQRINGTLHFLQPVTAHYGTIDKIDSTATINGIQLNDLKNNVLRRSGNQVITGRWRFTSNLVADDMQIKGKLSGVDLSQVLLKNSASEQIVKGKLYIQQAKFTHLSYENINGISKRELVTRSTNPQTITGHKRFTNVTSLRNINLIGQLNGYNWNNLVKNSINLASPNPVVLENLYFETSPSVTDLNVGRINGINVDEIVRNSVTTDELPNLAGQMRFRTISASHINLEGKLNGLNVPDDLVPLNSLQSIDAHLTFVGNVTFADELSVGSINDINITRDVVLRKSTHPQIVRGVKVFEGGQHIDKLVAPRSQLKDTNLADVEREMEGLDEENTTVVYDGKLVINGSLQVETINGIRIEDLTRILFSKTRDQYVSWPIKFPNKFRAGKISASLINGLRVPTDFVVRNSEKEQTIIGQKSFSQVSIENSDNLKLRGGIINNETIADLKKLIVKNDHETKKECFGRKMFLSVKVHGNIFAETVNGLVLDRDVMIADRPQNITGRLTFGDGVRVSSISFASLTADRLNNVPVNETLNHMVFSDQPEVELSSKTFLYGIDADEIEILGKINGVNVSDFLENTVRLDKPQAVYSALRFEDDVTFEQAIDARSINDHDLKRHFQDLVTRGSASSIPGKRIIHGNVFINGTLLVNKLNDGDPNFLQEFIFNPNLDNKFRRKVIFNSTVHVGSLEIDGQATLQGIYPRDLVPIDEPINLQKVVIHGNAEIKRELFIESGKINKCDLENILIFAQRNISTPSMINRPLNFSDLNIVGNLRLNNRRVNNVNLDDLASKVIKLSDHQKFNSTLVFDDDIIVDELVISGMINGIDLHDLYADSVKKSSRSEKITSRKTFRSIRVQDGNIQFKSDVTLFGLLNGYNVTSLGQSIVTNKNGRQIVRGRKIFISDNPIVFNDIETPSIGNVSLSDIVLVDTDENLWHDTVFLGNTIVNNMDIVNKFGRRSFNQATRASVEFKDLVNINNLYVKKIKGIPVENFVTRNGAHHLVGNYRLTNRVYVQGDLVMSSHSSINNIDLFDLHRRAIDLRRHSSVSGRVEFTGQLRFVKGFELNGTFGDRSKKDLSDQLTTITSSIEDQLATLEDKLQYQSSILHNYREILEKQPMKFHYFDIFDDLKEYNIDSENIERILVSRNFEPQRNGYITLLYLWLSNPQNLCAPQTFSFNIHKDGKLEEISTGDPGNAFPPTYLRFNGSLTSMSAWTSIKPYNCFEKTSYEEKVKSSSISVQSQSSAVSRTSHQSNLYNTFQDIKYFTDGDNLYAVTINSDIFASWKMSIVYKCSTSGCVKIQELYTEFHDDFTALDIIHSKVHNLTFLATINRPKNECERRPFAALYFWNSNQQQFIFIKKEEQQAPKDIMLLNIDHTGKVFMVVANTHNDISSCYSADEFAGVNIYSINFVIHIKLEQSLKHSVNTMNRFKVSPETYLVLGSRSSDSTYLYKYEGFNHFVQVKKYSTKGVKDIECYWTSEKDLFMAVATSDQRKCVIYKAFISGAQNDLY